MKKSAVVLAFMVPGLILAVPAMAQTYDPVINNGRVMGPKPCMMPCLMSGSRTARFIRTPFIESDLYGC